MTIATHIPTKFSIAHAGDYKTNERTKVQVLGVMPTGPYPVMGIIGPDVHGQWSVEGIAEPNRPLGKLPDIVAKWDEVE